MYVLYKSSSFEAYTYTINNCTCNQISHMPWSGGQGPARGKLHLPLTQTSQFPWCFSYAWSHHLIIVNNVPCSRKIWRELNLEIGHNQCEKKCWRIFNLVDGWSQPNHSHAPIFSACTRLRLRSMESELAVESCVQGHHVFNSIWTPTIGERKREMATMARGSGTSKPYCG